MTGSDYAALFPLIEGAEFDALVQDIKANGLQQPIVMYRDHILDGRNRFRACTKANIQPRFVQYDGDAPLAFVIAANLHRRHLTQSQRAVLAVDVLPQLEAEAKERQRSGKSAGRGKGDSRDHAGKMAKVSPRYVALAKALAAKAPDIATAVRKGVLNLSEASALARLPIGTRKRILARKSHDPKLHIGRAIASRTRHGTGKAVLYVSPPWEKGLEALRYLPIKAKAAADAVLFVHVPNERLADALFCLGCWGFKYAGNIVILNRSVTQHSLLVIGKRGKVTLPKLRTSVIRGTAAVKKTIARLYPNSALGYYTG